MPGFGNAEKDVVLVTWHACMAFDRAAQNFRWKADFIYYLSLALGVIAGLLSIFLLRYPEEMKEQRIHNDIYVYDVANIMLLVLPIISALLSALVSKKRYLHKWTVLHTTSRQFVAEIYRFRMKVAEYDEHTPVADDRDTNLTN